jgi:hypothetical protein
MPLYMHHVMDMVRSMEKFDYASFRDNLKFQAPSLDSRSQARMALRLQLLDSCLKHGPQFNGLKSFFRSGELTIVE